MGGLEGVGVCWVWVLGGLEVVLGFFCFVSFLVFLFVCLRWQMLSSKERLVDIRSSLFPGISPIEVITLILSTLGNR